MRLAHTEPGIAVLTLARGDGTGPNLMDERFCTQLQAACDTLAQDPALHALLLRAEGPSFCVGADLGALLARRDTLVQHLGGLIDLAHAAALALRRIPVPVIACVHAVAAGGGFSLAMLCDQVIAAAPARFVAAYPALGTSPDCGLSHTLAARVGPRQALNLALDTRALDLPRALALGVVDELAAPEQLQATALATARRLAAVPRQALVETKAHFLREDLALLAARLDAERAAFLRCAQTPAFGERLAAFGAGRRAG